MLTASDMLESQCSERPRGNWRLVDRQARYAFQPRPLFGSLSAPLFNLTRRTTRDIAAVAYVGLLLIAGIAPAVADRTTSSGLIAFDIPAQPLADALDAYGAATGLDVYYNGTLSIGRRSTAVAGKMSPSNALATLLGGTGYMSRVTGAGTISIVPEPLESPPPVVLPLQDMQQYAPFFAVVQARLSQALCTGNPADAYSNEIVFKFWISALGMITHVEIVAGSDDAARNQTIISGLEGMTIGEPAPAGMPQPLMMAVYPPAAGGAAGCALQ